MTDYNYKPHVKHIKIRREDDNSYVMMNPYGRILKINSVSKEIIELCNGKNTINDIVGKIAKQDKDVKNSVEIIIQEFLEKLAYCKIL